MNDLGEPRQQPAWYWVAAGLALVWEAFGCFMYVTQVTTDPATLPLDQRAIWQAMPVWSTAAYAIAVWVGLIGAFLLLLRKRAAVMALGTSLAAVIVQFSALIFVPAISGMISSDMLLGPILIGLVCYGIFQFSLTARRKGWVR
nr:hypothetical protein [uncultured Sphingomonas sp.]